MLRTLSFIVKHPLTRERRLEGLARLAKWQIQSRLRREVEVPWIEGTKLLVQKGMAGATGNIYCGLHEFTEMAFLLHFLRPDDLFVDVGANIGSYTILASAVAGANTIALEPDPDTIKALRRNVEVNNVAERVVAIQAAVGAKSGTAGFTVGFDSTNRIAGEFDTNVREVEVKSLDELLANMEPALIKLDVEGYEPEVICGARETLRKPSLLAIQTESLGDKVVKPLESAGFERLYYEPFSRRLLDGPCHDQSNALFVRCRTAVEDRLREARYRTVVGVQI